MFTICDCSSTVNGRESYVLIQKRNSHFGVNNDNPNVTSKKVMQSYNRRVCYV